MRIRVQLFAALRERAGAPVLELEVADGASVREVLAELRPLTAGLRVVMAVNHEYAGAEVVLHAGDELALIPPVSGGSVAPPHVRLTPEPLSLEELVARVADPRAGAVVTFSGVTREVQALEYEAYVQMAERQLTEIVSAAILRHGLCAAATEHRIGAVPLGEPSVVIAVSAPHRAQAFAGAQEIIDRLKAVAAIWKKEEGQWASGKTPPAAS